MIDVTHHREFSQGLRDLADFVDSHQDIELPYINPFTAYGYSSKEDAAMLLRRLGGCEKKYEGELFALVKSFGPLAIRYVFMRQAVCEAVVVGKRIVPAEPEKIVPAKVIPAIAAREEDVIEFRCQPILGRGASIVDMAIESMELPAPEQHQLASEVEIEIPF